MLTELQRKKMEKLFRVYDLNKDGRLDIHDFELLFQNVTKLQGILQDSPIYNSLHRHYRNLWKDLQMLSDSNQDDVITLEEWLLYHEALIGFTEIYENTIKKVIQELFNIFDLDKDNRISQDEFLIFYKAYCLDEGEADQIFERLDFDRDGYISRESFLQLFHQFYRSNNPQDLGNLIFGEY